MNTVKVPESSDISNTYPGSIPISTVVSRNVEVHQYLKSRAKLLRTPDAKIPKVSVSEFLEYLACGPEFDLSNAHSSAARVLARKLRNVNPGHLMVLEDDIFVLWHGTQSTVETAMSLFRRTFFGTRIVTPGYSRIAWMCVSRSLQIYG